jgi:hypothetical protein
VRARGARGEDDAPRSEKKASLVHQMICFLIPPLRALCCLSALSLSRSLAVPFASSPTLWLPRPPRPHPHLNPIPAHSHFQTIQRTNLTLTHSLTLTLHSDTPLTSYAERTLFLTSPSYSIIAQSFVRVSLTWFLHGVSTKTSLFLLHPPLTLSFSSRKRA